MTAAVPQVGPTRNTFPWARCSQANPLTCTEFPQAIAGAPLQQEMEGGADSFPVLLSRRRLDGVHRLW